MKEQNDMLIYEKQLFQNGYINICGVDEAGRGPLAGPVCAAAVILPKGLIIDGVNDSKKISEKKRELLFNEIINSSLAYGIAFADVEEIENLNILNATMLAMQRAVAELKIKPDFVLVDGQKSPSFDVPSYPLIKGDSLSESIAAASILAKVSRDRLMYKYAEKYPEYAFDKHKGYGTALHISKIKEYGPSIIHRKSFLKNILKENE